jgi:predicted TIM-barrel fold metal-dependent hydrolase
MSVPKIIDAKVQLLPPEWCFPGTEPPESESAILDIVYSHPGRDKALSQASVDGLLDEMERAGIDGALITGLPWVDPQRNDANNYYVRELCVEHPDQFKALGVMSDPRSVNAVDEVVRIDEVHRLMGCRVVPSWQGWKLDDPEFKTALSEMEKRGLLLLPHTDHPYKPDSEYDPSSALLKVAARHPDLKIIVPNLRGLKTGNVPDEKLLKNILYVGSVPTSLSMIELAVKSVGKEHVAFGTGFPFNASHDQRTAVQAFIELQLDADEREWLLGRSLREFVGWHE